MKNIKRILAVKIIRQVDTDPDTSYLGEYSNHAASEYSIDRAHSEDCASVSEIARLAGDKLKRVYDYLASLEPGIESADDLYESCNVVDELQTYVQECDCGERGDMLRNEYRYFNPCHENYKGIEEEEIRKYCRQDYQRMESYNHQNWCYIGIHAEAEITTGSPLHWIGSTVQTITSGGLWGTESDSDESYLKSIEQEELMELRAQLKALGFSTRQISAAFKNIQEVSE